MARPLRLYAPRAAFHVTARIQNGAALLTESLRDAVAEAICNAAQFCGAHLLAVAIMPNHFHLVVQQSKFPLGWMMQSAMQRTALLVQRANDYEGHVFGRRYWSCLCDTPMYVRQAIVYTHLNPWKARLCADAADYRWTSCPALRNPNVCAEWSSGIATERTLLLFASNSFDRSSCLANYIAFEAYAKARYEDATILGRSLFDWPADIFRPQACKGDDHWSVEYSRDGQRHERVVEKHDVAERAKEILHRIAPDCSLDMLRMAGRITKLSRIRRNVIAGLLTYGYRCTVIARCLYVSPSLVSDVARELRGQSKMQTKPLLRF
ncbi:MAG: transposase [Gemmatimonadota bacterium]